MTIHVATTIDDDLNETTEKRGASGARLIIGEKYTTKLDVERTGTFVRDQGAWLSCWNEIEALPLVTEVFPGGYIMETLEVPDLCAIDTKSLLLKILHVLEKQFWFKSAAPRILDYNEHSTYVHHLTANVESNRAKLHALRAFARRAREVIDFTALASGMTHGDCIVDNVAFRRGTLVLLDPIPATHALPNIRAVDVGRLIQSAIGYESVRYRRDRGGLKSCDDGVNFVLNQYMMGSGFNVNEARACLYFAIIHMLRGIRTTTPETATRLALWYLTNELIEVTKQWMR